MDAYGGLIYTPKTIQIIRWFRNGTLKYDIRFSPLAIRGRVETVIRLVIVVTVIIIARRLGIARFFRVRALSATNPNPARIVDNMRFRYKFCFIDSVCFPCAWIGFFCYFTHFRIHSIRKNNGGIAIFTVRTAIKD